MNLPEKLRPTGETALDLPSTEVTCLPMATPTFEPWNGERPEDTYGGKMVLGANGEPAFAEIRILRLLQRAGWNGVWVDTYRRTYRQEYWGEKTDVTLPAEAQPLISQIREENGGSASGCFDVYAWNEDEVLFAEAKRKSRDSVRDSQKRWVESALRAGVPPSSLLVVEWSVEEAA